jgi:hypothetical protein
VALKSENHFNSRMSKKKVSAVVFFLWLSLYSTNLKIILIKQVYFGDISTKGIVLGLNYLFLLVTS